jgi:3-isopropylmalate dehydrogenase
MEKRIAVLSGDGIGPEIIAEAVKVLKAVEQAFGHNFHFENGLIGAAAIDAEGTPLPGNTLQTCLSSDAILFGAIGDPKYDNDPQAKVRPEQGLLALRSALGLFANIRPIKSYPQLIGASPLKEHLLKDVDFVVVRELIGGIYFGKPRGRSEDGLTAFDTCVYSKNEIERVTHIAFKMAQKRRKKVTMLDKANVLATSRLWREVVTAIAKEYPDVELECNYIDSAAMQVIQQPGRFDIILTENLFGDIISDEASVIAGSLGILPSASVGEKTALFEPIHGSYPQAKGKNIANPMATILSAAMLLDYAFGLKEEALCIENAVNTAMDKGIVTPDINNGKKTTADVGTFIASQVMLKSGG